MIKLSSGIMGRWWMPVVMTAWLSVFTAAYLWPASWWFEVRTVNAGPAKSFQSVPMAVDRDIKRPFLGEWHVTLRRWSDTGWYVFCTANGTSNYRAASELPKNLTLGWWTEGACDVLPTGRYVMTTSWDIRPTIAPLPTKHISIESNIFEVTP